VNTLRELGRAGRAAVAVPPMTVVAGVVLAVTLLAKGNGAGHLSTFWLREIIPLSAGVAAGAVPTAENALELQLSLPVPFRVTLARREGLLLAWTIALVLPAALIAYAAGWWQPVAGPVAGQLTWFAPAIALVGLGVLCAVTSGSAGAAMAVVGGVWLVQELSGEWFTGRLTLIYLFADDRQQAWLANRFTLMTFGALALAVAWGALTRPDHLMSRQS
jgi:hypothetical protein